MIYGYLRASTDRQSVEAQLRQLRAAVAGKVFRELASGAKTERAQPPRSLGRATAIGPRVPKSAITSLDERQSPAPMKERHR